MEEKELFPEGHYPWPKRRKYIVITLEVSLSNAVKELDKALHGWEEAELDKIIAFTNGQVRAMGNMLHEIVCPLCGLRNGFHEETCKYSFNFVPKEWVTKEEFPKSITGYSCPVCGSIATERTLIHSTPEEFVPEPDPHYAWVETHKCCKCGTTYTLNNGT